MVLLSSLPKELLQLVLSFTDQQSLGRISIASRQWNALSVPILYKQPLFEVWDQFDLFARAVLSNRTVTAHSSRILPRLGLLVQEIDLVNVPHRWERLMVARAESLVQQWTNITYPSIIIIIMH
ncbi:hypothetical protein BDEG_22997 [Batrachochytrium dendrobatidis JEL423]|uniref:F-box domain-containing protein n=1 Tax=Batrachochytrium dendrobatidis (strain JEL423) TaxID=403673 RepID=A0A177WHG0_BATDL|nr:hypothetical protein BDEG_22997 [Batrachochytrium dendrobatidis JEL423]